MLADDKYRRHRLLVWDYLIALGLAACYLVLLLATMDMGFTRDEGYYFHAAEDYQGWFDELEENTAVGRRHESFTQAGVDRHWSYNPEHPVLMKTLFALSWNAFGRDNEPDGAVGDGANALLLRRAFAHESERLGPLLGAVQSVGTAIDWAFDRPSTSMRLPTAVLGALLLALVYLFTREAFGSRSGAFFAAAAIGFMPRLFFHAHLACFDLPITTMWVLVVYAYWRSYDSRLWAVLTGIFFGLALITKLNAFFLPLVLLLHWAIAGRRKFSLEQSDEDGRAYRLPRLRIPDIPRAFVAMAFLGPLIFYLGWPRHWFDSFNRILWYIGRHWNHEHYYVYYFGEALVRPPFPVEFPFIMTLVTVPIVTLLTALLGCVVLGAQWRGRARPRVKTKSSEPAAQALPADPRATGVLLVLNMLLPIALIAQPHTPVFGGTKHWMNGMPFLAMLSGLGVGWAIQSAVKRRSEASHRLRLVRGLTVAALLTILTVPLVHATLYVHPYGTSYYNEAIGGVRGAADSELMRQFWGYSTRAGLGMLNEVAPERASVFPHNANNDSMRWYRRDGLMRDDIRQNYDPHRADYAFINHQRAFIDVLRDVWAGMGTQAPMRVWTLHGVPVLSLYASPEHR